MNIRALALCVLMGLHGFAFCTQLKAIDIKEGTDKTTVFLSLNTSLNPKIFSLSKPDRLVIDLNQTQLAFNTKEKNFTNSLIKTVRYGRPNATTLRVVLEITAPVRFKAASWQPEEKQLKGVSIALIAENKPIKMRTKPLLIHHSPQKKLREVVVVLDAGHGGKDPGARGPKGSQEKDVVLAIALKLKDLIDKQSGMKAVLTRKGDYYVGLRQRLDIARKYDGDIFVAIHADAYINRQSKGASVFALSQTGATSEAARWVAEKENYSELGGVDLSDLDDQNGIVRSVLIDLSQTATIGASLEMGQQVLGQLGKMTTLHHDQVEQARFVVLKSPDIPSILIETGFISNPREEKNLTSAAYQRRMSLAIFQGLKQYFLAFPPAGTKIEAMTERKLYIVKAGDTLSGIASLYKISLNELCSRNHLLKNAGLQIGQKLVIPS